MAVLEPLKVVTITDWPARQGRHRLDGRTVRGPHDVPQAGFSRPVPFSSELLRGTRRTSQEDPPKGFRRLVPGGEVRLRYAYVIRCDEVVKADDGSIVELRCSVDPGSRGGSTSDGRKVRGTIHWVSATAAIDAEVRLWSFIVFSASRSAL